MFAVLVKRIHSAQSNDSICKRLGQLQVVFAMDFGYGLSGP